MFWHGLILGLFVGSFLGILIMALCFMSSRAEEDSKRDQGFSEMHGKSYTKSREGYKY